MTVQLPPETHSRLQQLAEARHETLSSTLAWLINFEAETRFWNEFQEGSIAMRTDADTWGEEQRERASWDATLHDGLDNA